MINFYFPADATDSQKFLSNIMDWMQPGSGPYRVGILSDNVEVYPVYNNTKFKGEKVFVDRNLGSRLAQYDILVVNNLIRFVNYGADIFDKYLALPNKGLIVGKARSYVTQINKFIEPLGIYWVIYEMISVSLGVNQRLLPTTHVSCIYNNLRNGVSDNKSNRLQKEFLEYTAQNGGTNSLMKKLLEDYNSYSITKDYIPTPDKPVTKGKILIAIIVKVV